jgi:hypothetical protein
MPSTLRTPIFATDGILHSMNDSAQDLVSRGVATPVIDREMSPPPGQFRDVGSSQ